MTRSGCILLGTAFLLALACRDGRRDVAGASPAAVHALGPSTIKRHGLSVQSTLLGRVGGTAPPAVAPISEPTPSARGALPAQPFVLTGADIYRTSCRSCHGRDGAGKPPTINSIIGPVQGTSAALLRQRMAKAGMKISEKMVSQLVREARDSVDMRLDKGGQKMPAFAYLTTGERSALWEYMRSLARVPGGAARPKTQLKLSAVQVGTLVVRGTCHICHDGAGPGSRHQMMMYGVIPSLESMATRPFWMFADKVETGQARGMMGGMRGRGMMGGGMRGMGMMRRAAQMPAFPYFTRAEIAAAYAFLRN